MIGGGTEEWGFGRGTARRRAIACCISGNGGRGCEGTGREILDFVVILSAKVN